jgi:hypothetical protein
MRQHRPEADNPAPWCVPVAVEEVAEAGQHFDLVANENVRAELARMAGLRDLPRLEANFDVARHGRDGLHVAGRVSATVGQTCVVTLEHLSNEVDEIVDLVFMPEPAGVQRLPAAEGTDEPREVKWDEPEPLIGGVIDLGALATEFLMLGLDPYPRKPGAVFHPPRQELAQGGQFTALAKLKKG